MKLIKSLIPAGILLAAMFFTACEVPAYPDTNVLEGMVNTSLEAYKNPRGTVELENLNVTLPSDYIKGFDASAIDKMEEDGQVWYDSNCQRKDIFEILKENGVNTIRIRIWNDPDSYIANNNVELSGECNLDRVIRMAKRVKKAGLKFMLDFHYSDVWADPGCQVVPVAWQRLTSASDVEAALYEYTYTVMNSLNAAGVTPDYVQVGNEINNGILLHNVYNPANSVHGSASGFASFPTGGVSTTNFITYLKAGCKAVRFTAPDAKVILHIASSNNPDNAISKIEAGDVDYDIIGLSYYPIYSSHGTISDLKTRIQSYAAYNKQVVITETTFDWNYNNESATNLNNAYSYLLDPETSAVYADLEIGTLDSKTCVLGSVENQAKVLRHIMEESADAGAVGICSWGGELGDWHAMFDYQCVALPSLKVFTLKGN